jgi:hypothetical protein
VKGDGTKRFWFRGGVYFRLVTVCAFKMGPTNKSDPLANFIGRFEIVRVAKTRSSYKFKIYSKLN